MFILYKQIWAINYEYNLKQVWPQFSWWANQMGLEVPIVYNTIIIIVLGDFTWKQWYIIVILNGVQYYYFYDNSMMSNVYLKVTYWLWYLLINTWNYYIFSIFKYPLIYTYTYNIYTYKMRLTIYKLLKIYFG